MKKVHISAGLLGRSHMSKSVGILARFWREEDGAAAAEYALLLAIIAAGLAVG